MRPAMLPDCNIAGRKHFDGVGSHSEETASVTFTGVRSSLGLESGVEDVGDGFYVVDVEAVDVTDWDILDIATIVR